MGNPALDLTIGAQHGHARVTTEQDGSFVSKRVDCFRDCDCNAGCDNCDGGTVTDDNCNCAEANALWAALAEDCGGKCAAPFCRPCWVAGVAQRRAA